MKPNGPTNHVWDGRMLDAQDALKRASGKDEGQAPATVVKGNPVKRPPGKGQEERPMMTPPQISGVSLAPIPDAEVNGKQQVAAVQHMFAQHDLNGGRPGAVVRKHAPLKMAIPPNAQAGSSPPQGGANGLSLWAEGRSLQRNQGASLVPKYNDPNEAYFHEINDSTSPCATPPAISFEAIKGNLGQLGPLGPISPTPLSPSILTICGELGEPFDLNKQENMARDIVTPEGNDSKAWGSFSDLPDMRKCESPQIPSH